MSNVQLFVEHLESLEPQKNSARSTALNYFKYWQNPKEALTPALIQNFYRFALHFHFWTENKGFLSETIKSDLKSFALNHPNIQGVLPHIFHPTELQLVPITQNTDAETICASTMKSLGEQINVLTISKRQCLTICMAKNDYHIALFSRTALIQKDRLRPLSPLTRLRYDKDLSLKVGVTQRLQIDPLRFFQFQIDDSGKAKGYSLNNHFLKPQFIHKFLQNFEEAHSSLCSLEAHFIQDTPSQWDDVSEILEKARAYLLSQHTTVEELSFCKKAIEFGQEHLKGSEEKEKPLLYYLVSNLEYLYQENVRKQNITEIDL